MTQKIDRTFGCSKLYTIHVIMRYVIMHLSTIQASKNPFQNQRDLRLLLTNAIQIQTLPNVLRPWHPLYGARSKLWNLLVSRQAQFSYFPFNCVCIRCFPINCIVNRIGQRSDYVSYFPDCHSKFKASWIGFCLI